MKVERRTLHCKRSTSSRPAKIPERKSLRKAGKQEHASVLSCVPAFLFTFQISNLRFPLGCGHGPRCVIAINSPSALERSEDPVARHSLPDPEHGTGRR